MDSPRNPLALPVSLFQGTGTTPTGYALLGDLLTRIAEGTYQEAVARCRARYGDDAAYKAAKLTLPSFTPACALQTRAHEVPWANKLLGCTGLVHFDFDHVGEAETFKQHLATDAHCAFAFISPSDRGVKAGFAVGGITDADTYRRAWSAFSHYLQQTYPDAGFATDGQVKYLHALCFVSHDPLLYRCAHPRVFIPPPVPPAPPRRPPPLVPPDSARLQDALQWIAPEAYETWLQVGMALHASGEAQAVWDAWSATSTKYQQRTQDATWQSFRQDDSGIHLGTVFHLAQQGGWQPPRREVPSMHAPPVVASVGAPTGGAPPGPGEDWRTALMVDAKGRPKETIANMDILLAHLPVMDAVWWNAFHQEVMWDTRPFTPEDLHTIAAALASTYGLALTRRTLLSDAITTYAKTHRTRDPLLTYVQGLTWDGIPRLAYWMVNYLGAAPTPANSAIGTALCCAMVARALQPGCIQRLVVILEGPENIGKSEVCKILGAPWSDTLFRHMDTRDAQLLLHGCWLMEIPELDAYRKTEDSAIKAFISNTLDTYIPKYSNLRARIPRRTVFVGTVNPTGPYLKGQTGNTRFLPVACTTIDLPGLRLVRDKLLAEARSMVERGDHWWEAVEQMEEIDTLREARRDSSVFEPLIAEWLTQTGRHDHAEYVTMEEVLRKALGIMEPERWKDKALTIQVGIVIHQCGWVRARVQAEGLRQWVYRKP